MSLMTVIDGATVAPAKLAEALAKAQAKIKNPAKDHTADIKSDRGSYKYKYSTLADGLDAIRAALSENGLSVTQTTDFEGELLVLYTRLLHSSGEWIGSRWPVGAFSKMNPQQTGSALTYARRYSLFGIVGISGGDEDDDGEAASQPSKAAIPSPPSPPQVPQGKRVPPRNWMEETKKLFDGAPTYDKLNGSHDKLLKTFHFDQIELDQVEALLMESAKKFFEENQDA